MSVLVDPTTGVNTNVSYVYMNGMTPVIRCDKGMAPQAGNGCVYAQAPAVMVMSLTDSRVAESSQHIRDAQSTIAIGGLDVDPVTQELSANWSKALQRTRVRALADANRNMACQYTDSVIKLRQQSSPACSAGTVACDCDEYPFSSTWNGAWNNSYGTSARYINRAHNQQAGAWLGGFYQTERVLDFTPDTNKSFDRANPSESIPDRVGGDDFWIYIE